MFNAVSRHIRLAVAWKGTIVAEATTAPGKPLFAGLSRRSRLRWPVADPGGYDVRVVSWGADGLATLSIPGHEGGTRVHPSGECAAITFGELTLTEGEWGVARAGVYSVYFQWVEPPSRQTHRRQVNWNAMALAVGVTYLHVIALLLFIARPPEATARTFEIPERIHSALVAEPPEPDEDTDIDQDEMADDVEMAGAEVTSDDTRFDVNDDGGGDDQPLGAGSPIEGAGESELLAALQQGMQDNASIQRVFGETTEGFDTSFSGFTTAGIGAGEASFGGPVGGGRFGPPGGGRGPGDGPGQQRQIGGIPDGDGVSTSVGRARRAEVARIQEHQVRPSGNGLAQSEIARVVQRHSRGLRYCYERELMTSGAADGGRVTAQWTIDLRGRVAQVQIVEDTLRSQNVSSCVLSELRQMRFPEPEGAMVVVSYPFTFRSAE